MVSKPWACIRITGKASWKGLIHPTLEFLSAGLGQSLRSCTSNKLQVKLMLLIQGIHLRTNVLKEGREIPNGSMVELRLIEPKPGWDVWLRELLLHGIILEIASCDSLVAQRVKNPPTMWETWVRFLGWEDPLEEGMATHCSILAWRIPKYRGVWQATVHGITKNWAEPSYWAQYTEFLGHPRWLRGNESVCEGRRHWRHGSVPVLGRSPEGGNGNPLQYSCLENPMDRGASWAQSMGSQRVTTERLNTHTHTHTHIELLL